MASPLPSPAQLNAIDRSFASSPMVNPASNLRDSIYCLNFFWVELFIPVAALSTSVITPGSRPKR